MTTTPTPAPLILRYMRPEDVPTVAAIDRESFTNPWSENSYRFEVRENPASHMAVLELAGGIVGVAGMWLIVDEGHISTIAVRPQFRGRGYGEVLLAGLLARGIVLGATYALLEVRVSNTNAINLYRKYEFEITHRRRNYYKDNHEDAYMMFIHALDAAYQTRFAARVAALRGRVAYQDWLPEGRPTPPAPVD